MLPLQQALRSLRRSNHFASLQTGPAEFAAQQSLCVPANLDFPASNILCSRDNRLCRVCGAAITLRPCNSALRTFRRRTSYAPLTTGSAEFSAQQSLCVPAIRPCGLSGVEHLMLPLQQALPSFRRSNHFASLQTGPAVFSGTGMACFRRPCGLSGVILCSPDNRLCRVFRSNHFAPLQFGPADFPASNILCSPDNRLCRVFGAAITLRPCKPALPSFRAQAWHASPTGPALSGGTSYAAGSAEFSAQQVTFRPCNSALRTFRRRTSYAPLTTGSAEFSAQQSLCVPAIRPCGLSGVEHLMLP